MNWIEALFGIPEEMRRPGAVAAPPAPPANNVPRTVPIPATPPPRPPTGATLPGGSFTPSRMPANQVPIPQQRPMQQAGGVPITGGMNWGKGQPGEIRRGPDGKTYQYAQTTGMAGANGDWGWIERAAQSDQPSNPLRDLLMGGAAGGDWRQMLRAFGAGAANIGNTGGDPYRAFGRGLGGATGYYDDREAAAAKAKQEAESTAYKRSQDAADMELRQAAEKRAAKTADLANQKSAIEIRKLAAQDGITPSAYLKLRAQAEEDLGEAVIPDPVKRQQMVDDRYEELLRGYKEVSGLEDKSLSEGPGISGNKPVTATGPNGEKIILKDGQWVPYNQ